MHALAFGQENRTLSEYIDWAADHGISGFFLSWWGKDSLTDKHLRAGLLKASNLKRIRFAIYYESMGRLDPARISKLDVHGNLLSGDPPSKEAFLHAAMYGERPDDGRHELVEGEDRRRGKSRQDHDRPAVM